MNNSKAPKIVVGVGLVAAYAAGLTFLTLRDKPSSAIADTQTAPVSAQMVAAPVSPPLDIAEPVDASAPADALSPAANAAVATPAPAAVRPSVAAAPKPRIEEVPIAALPSPRPPAVDAEELSRSNSGSNAVSELAATAGTAASESPTSAEEKPSDTDESSAEVPAAVLGN